MCLHKHYQSDPSQHPHLSNVPSLLPSPLSSSSLNPLPNSIRNHTIKVFPKHPRRERDKRARSLFVKGKVLDFYSLEHIHGHCAQIDAQEGRHGVGFHGKVLPEVVGAQVGFVGFGLDGCGTGFYVFRD